MDTPPTKMVLELLQNLGFTHPQIDAAVSITTGLLVLKEGRPNVPLELLQKWKGLINQVEISRTAPDPTKSLIYREDGMPG